MIKNVVFDMGRVMIEFSPSDILRRFGAKDSDLPLLMDELFQHTEWIQMDEGTLTEDEVITRVCNRLPVALHSIIEKAVKQWYIADFKFLPGIEMLIRKLKENGYHIYMLSNAGLSHRKYRDRLPAIECFDGVVVSAEINKIKPNREIYEYLFERYDLLPEECVFVDDTAINVLMSERCGMRAILYRDTESLIHALNELGVNTK